MGEVSTLSSEQRNWAMAAHLSALLAFSGLPFGHILGPLIVLLVKRAESPFVERHAKASLNFQITASLGWLIFFIAAVAGYIWIILALSRLSRYSGASESAGIGILVFFACVFIIGFSLAIVSLVFIIQGAMRASSGEEYRYPVSFTFVR